MINFLNHWLKKRCNDMEGDEDSSASVTAVASIANNKKE